MSKVVMIVDDEASNIDLLKSLLPADYKVKAATSGELAIKIVSKKMPDVIFLDVQMPTLSGPETSHTIRQLEGGDELKIVYVSGSELPPEVNGENGFLLKPVNQQKLTDILASIL